MSFASASGRCSRVSEAVTDPVGRLAAELRARGSRVGLGEVLMAHRALAAVDCAQREESRLALRAVLCSTRADLERFDLVFEMVFGPDAVSPGGYDDDVLSELGLIERAVLPRAGIGHEPVAEPSGEPPAMVPAAYSAVERLR